jgi:hypothetical protein
MIKQTRQAVVGPFEMTWEFDPIRPWVAFAGAFP